MADIVPFPLYRRAGLVSRIASSMSGLSNSEAHQALVRRLELEQAALQRAGIVQERIDDALVELTASVKRVLAPLAGTYPGETA